MWKQSNFFELVEGMAGAGLPLFDLPDVVTVTGYYLRSHPSSDEIALGWQEDFDSIDMGGYEDF